MHANLTAAEAAVLTAMNDTTTRRWWDHEGLELETGLERRHITYAIHELDRRDLIARKFSGISREWTITTAGERALARKLPWSTR